MSKKQALFAVVEYLHELVATKGAVPADSVESVEVAIQCLNDAFGLEFDASAPQSSSLSLKARGLGLEGVIASALGAPSSATSASSASAPATAGATPINYEQILAASEALKSQGNVFMKDTKYEAAIDSYAQAIKKSEGLPSANNGARSVYYANRAAALLCIKSFEEAASDCEESVKLDPAYAKAYGRLGLARLHLGLYEEAKVAYVKGLELDPGNEKMKTELKQVEDKLKGLSAPSVPQQPAQPPFAGGGGGGGGGANPFAGFGGAGGGMPDIGALLNNPQMMNMASQMMQSGAFNNILSNPAFAQMAQNMFSGAGAGGAPGGNDEEEDE